MITKKQQKTIHSFMGFPERGGYLDWNYLMYHVVPRIEQITDTRMEIREPVSFSWWYSTKKKMLNGSNEPRKPFDCIGGKFHNIVCYYSPDIQFKVKKYELEKTKIEATINCCYRFIVWYNLNVLKKS